MTKKNWEKERKTIKKNIWKIVRLPIAIKCNSMNVFKMNLAEFFGEKNYKKNYLMMDLSSSSLFRICCGSHKKQHQQQFETILFHIRRWYCLRVGASWSWRSLVNESIITGFLSCASSALLSFVCMNLWLCQKKSKTKKQSELEQKRLLEKFTQKSKINQNKNE